MIMEKEIIFTFVIVVSTTLKIQYSLTKIKLQKR